MSFIRISGDGGGNDKLRKVRFLYDHIRQQCSKLWQPNKHISIDERLVRSKARFSYKQYIKNKPVRFGFKVFALCDSVSKFLVNFKIYTGRENNQPEQGLAHKTVIELMESYFGQGYFLYTDNFYSSPALYTDLRDNYSCCAVGTCQTNRKDFPADLKDAKAFDKKAKRSDMRFHRTASNVLCQQWKDKRTVTAISTRHCATDFIMVRRSVKEGNVIREINTKKPRLVEDYNKYMGGVDVFDQYAASYRLLRKTKKFWKTLFYDLIEIAVINSFIAFQFFRKQHPELVSLRPPNSYSDRQFRLNLVQQLADIHDKTAPMNTRGPGAQTTTAAAPTTACVHIPQVSRARKNCHVCQVRHQREQKTSIFCSTCKNRLGHPLAQALSYSRTELLAIAPCCVAVSHYYCLVHISIYLHYVCVCVFFFQVAYGVNTL